MGEKRTQANIAEHFYSRTIIKDVKEFVSLKFFSYEIALFSILHAMVPALKPIYVSVMRISGLTVLWYTPT